jgi:hypothetical protein
MFPKWKLHIMIWKLCQVSFETAGQQKRKCYFNLVLWISKLPMGIAPEISAYRF